MTDDDGRRAKAGHNSSPWALFYEIKCIFETYFDPVTNLSNQLDWFGQLW